MTILNTVYSLATEVLAVVPELPVTSDNFPPPGDLDKAITNSSVVFNVVQRVFAVVGIGIVVWTAKGVIQALIKPEPATAIKKFVGGTIAAVLCFRLSLPLTAVEGIGSLLQRVIEAFNNTLKD
jgi:hypothetical protein